MIREARDDELEQLRDIERAAGEPFRAIGMAVIADDEPPSRDALARYVADHRAWVHTADGDRPVAYLIADVVDGAAHIEQVSVDPDHARRGLGAALIETAADWATRQDLATMTLMTFAEVPWNRPYYERLGFRVIAAGELTPELTVLREREIALGLHRWPRVAMRREGWR